MKTENGVKSTIQTDPCDYKGHTHAFIFDVTPSTVAYLHMSPVDLGRRFAGDHSISFLLGNYTCCQSYTNSALATEYVWKLVLVYNAEVELGID